MIVGDPNVFAIESEITEAYERLSSRAIGFFVIHASGKCFGVKEADATLLACSFDEVGRRLADRGIHIPCFPLDANAGEIAFAFRRTHYSTDRGGNDLFFEMDAREFGDAISSRRLVWAPDGDEAFDDSSYVLQFENEHYVRLVAFKSVFDSLYDPESVCEVRLSADSFYAILRSWRDRFESIWEAHPKMPEGYN